MCEPTTIMMGIGLAVSAIGGAVSAAQQKKQYDAASDAASYESEQARQNAVMTALDRDDALERGAVEEERMRMKTEAIKGRQRTSLAAGGIELGDGSALTALADTAMLGELDALTHRRNAEREAYGLDVQRSEFGQQANIAAMEASGLRRAGRTALATGIFSTAADTGLGVGSAFGGDMQAGMMRRRANRAAKLPKSDAGYSFGYGLGG